MSIKCPICDKIQIGKIGVFHCTCGQMLILSEEVLNNFIKTGEKMDDNTRNSTENFPMTPATFTNDSLVANDNNTKDPGQLNPNPKTCGFPRVYSKNSIKTNTNQKPSFETQENVQNNIAVEQQLPVDISKETGKKNCNITMNVHADNPNSTSEILTKSLLKKEQEQRGRQIWKRQQWMLRTVLGEKVNDTVYSKSHKIGGISAGYGFIWDVAK